MTVNLAAGVAVEDSNISYETNSDGTLCITGYSKEADEFVIPEELDGKKVTALGLFDTYQYKCTSIQVPDFIETIYRSFQRTSGNGGNLQAINVDENNENYSSVDGVLFDKEQTTIIEYPVDKRTQAYSIPEGVIYLEASFRNNSYLSKVTLPSTLEYITCADNIKTSFYSSPLYYDQVSNPFVQCSALTSIEVAKGNTKFASKDGVLFDYDMTTLLAYPYLKGNREKSYTVPDSVTKIGSCAFNHVWLDSVELPSNLKTIGSCAFWCCRRLESITLPEGLEEILPQAFSQTDLTAVTLPESLKTIGWLAFGYCKNLTSVTITKNVYRIGAPYDYKYDRWGTGSSNIFIGCTSLTEVNVDEASAYYTSVDGVLYTKDKTLLLTYPTGKEDESFEIPSSVTEIVENAFSENSFISEAFVPNGVTKIGGGAFSSCTNLKSLYIPASVTKIGYGLVSSYSMPECIIYGETGSYIEEYCEKNGLNFNSIRRDVVLNDSNSGIAVEAKEGAFPAGTVIEVTKVGSAEDGDKKSVSFDITPKNADGEKVQPNGYVTVKIPVPEGFDAANCKIYHVDDNGARRNIAAWVEDDYIVFMTNKFSKFIITAYELNDNDPDPDTGSGSEEPEPGSGSESEEPTPSESGSESEAPTPSESGSESEAPTPSESGSESENPTPSESGSESEAPTPSESGSEAEPIETPVTIPSPTGSFTVPETVASENTTQPPAAAETTTAKAAEATTTTAVINDSESPAATTSAISNTFSAPASETVSANDVGNAGGGAQTDKNVNTGFVFAFIPAAAAAVGVVIAKKRK